MLSRQNSFHHLLDKKFDGALGVRIPLAHHGKDFRNVRLGIDEALEALETAQIKVGCLC